MTKQQFDKLSKYEQVFRWAINSNFIHLSNGEFKEVSILYTEVYNDKLSPAQMSCNACRLKALKQLGNDYFAKKEDIAKREAKKAEKQAEEEKKKTEVKKTSGRPPKINLNA